MIAEIENPNYVKLIDPDLHDETLVKISRGLAGLQSYIHDGVIGHDLVHCKPYVDQMGAVFFMLLRARAKQLKYQDSLGWVHGLCDWVAEHGKKRGDKDIR